MVSVLTFKSLTRLIFVRGACRIGASFHYFICEYPISQYYLLTIVFTPLSLDSLAY